MSEYDRIAFGEETRVENAGLFVYTPTESEHCPDCEVRRGTEHERGCHIEQCPICGEPLVGCGHRRSVLG